MSDKPKVLIVGAGSIGTIGHIDHGTTTVAAVLANKIHETKRTLDEITEGADIHQEIEKTSNPQFGKEPFIIKNYRADYEVSPTKYLNGREKRNLRREKERKQKNGRNRK